MSEGGGQRGGRRDEQEGRWRMRESDGGWGWGASGGESRVNDFR